jgi:hypothetical protein
MELLVPVTKVNRYLGTIISVSFSYLLFQSLMLASGTTTVNRVNSKILQLINKSFDTLGK